MDDYLEMELTAFNESDVRISEEEGLKLINKPCCIDKPYQGKCCDFNQPEFEEFRKTNLKLIQGQFFVVKHPETGGVLFQITPVNSYFALDKARVLLEDIQKLKDIKDAVIKYHDESVYTAVILIRLFIQANYTGPDFDSDTQERLDILESFVTGNYGDELDDILYAGKERDTHVKYPMLLLVSEYFFSCLKNLTEAWPYYLIWKFRLVFLHQKILTERDPFFQQRLKFLADSFLTWRKLECHKSPDFDELEVLFLAEIAEMLNYYFDGMLSKRFLYEGLHLAGIGLKFTGKQGVRTKFQTTPTSQVCLEYTESGTSLMRNSNSKLCPEPESWTPESLPLNDDTRLERVRLVEESPYTGPTADIAMMLLGSYLQLKNTFVSDFELRKSEVEAIVNLILDHRNVWSPVTLALMARSRLEKNDKRAVDRALRQMDRLSNLIGDTQHRFDVVFRQYLFFGGGHPTKTNVMFELAEILLTSNCIKQALDIYETLGAFNELVICYSRTNQKHRAEAMIKEKIDNSGKTADLLILLGDVTGDINNYKEAWTISKEKSSKAQKRLGAHFHDRSQWTEAIPHLKLATTLAPLDYLAWLQLAWACYSTEDYETAFQAYLRAVNMEYDNYPTWNNLGTCALRLFRPKYALRAFKMAVKCNYDEPRIWMNIVFLATDLEELNTAIEAYHRIIDLKKNFTDEEVLERMVHLALDSPSIEKVKLVIKLLTRVNYTSSNMTAMHLYGRMLTAYVDLEPGQLGDIRPAEKYEQGLHYYDKAVAKMRQDPNWKTDIKALSTMLDWIVEYRERREHGKEVLQDALAESSTLKGYDKNFRSYLQSLHQIVASLKRDEPKVEASVAPLLEMINMEKERPFYNINVV